MSQKTIIICCDGTGSMRTYFRAIRNVLPQVITMLMPLYGKEINVFLAVYHDYDNKSPNNERGGYSISNSGHVDDCLYFINKSLIKVRGGGGDGPEAALTAFVNLYDFIKARSKDSETLILHCTDHIPHGLMGSKKAIESGNLDDYKGRDKKYHAEELKYLQMYGDIHNWKTMCEKMKELLNVSVVTVCNVEQHRRKVYEQIGDFLHLTTLTEPLVRETIMKVILDFQGVGKQSNYINYGTPIVNFCSTKRTKVYKLVKQIKNDPNSTRRVLDAFNLLTKTLEGAESIASYELFGHLWRFICGPLSKIDLYKWECDKLKVNMNYFSARSKTIRDWLSESYNSIDEIIDIIEEATPKSKQKYIIDADVEIKKEELFDLIRGCMIQNFKKIRKFLACLKTVDITDEEDGLPLELSNENIFALLPHLLFSGTKFSLRGSLIVATLCLDIKPLKGKADEFLMKHRGKWLDFKLTETHNPVVGENWSVGIFLSIYSRLVDTEYLTEEENEFIKPLLSIVKTRSKFYGTIDSTVDVLLARDPELNNLRHDHKSVCKVCDQYRSDTVMINGVCARDVDDCDCGYTPCKCWGGAFKDNNPNQSHMVKCRSCGINYSIIGVNTLNVVPKCYYCRFAQPLDKVECEICLRSFPNPSKKVYENGYTCRQCDENPQAGFEDKVITIRDLLSVEKSSEIYEMFSIPKAHKDTTLNQFKRKIYDMLSVDIKLYDTPEDSIGSGILFMPDGRKVINVKEVTKKIIELRDTDHEETCTLCYMDYPSRKMSFSCGCCNNRMCLDCIKEWYGKSQSGKLICKSYLECPFCKRTPKYKIWIQAGKYLRQLNKRTDWDPTYWHAWCRRCNRITNAVLKECAGGVPPLDDFQCEECTEEIRINLLNSAIDYKVPTMKCPGCGVDVEKISGCDHITCTCGQHFCFRCGEGFDTGDATYQHMYNNCDGGNGLYAGDNYYNDDDYYY